MLYRVQLELEIPVTQDVVDHLNYERYESYYYDGAEDEYYRHTLADYPEVLKVVSYTRIESDSFVNAISEALDDQELTQYDIADKPFQGDVVGVRAELQVVEPEPTDYFAIADDF